MAITRNNLYSRAAAALDGYNFDSATLAHILGCSEDSAATLRSLYNTCKGDPMLMQAKANDASRNSKARRRMAA
jgi:hypothetical protein